MSTTAPSRYAEPAPPDLLERACAALVANGFAAEVAAGAEEARELVLAAIEDGSAVYTARSATLDETGIEAAINGSDRLRSLRNEGNLLDPATQRREYKRLIACPDVVVGSVHAVTLDGKLLAASATGAQLGQYAWLAEQVIFVVGAQKVVRDLAEGYERIEQHCLPLESERTRARMGMDSFVGTVLTIANDSYYRRIRVIMLPYAVGF